MAVFGPQLIYTIIMFVLLAKLGKFYSFGRYLLTRKLYRYLSPNSNDLKKAVRNHYKSQNSKNKKLSRLFEIDDDKEEFNIPEGATIELAMSPVLPYDLYYIKYTDDFQSFVDVSCIGILIYITTEVYVAFFKPVDEINLSVVWCSMIILYGIGSLASIARNYLRTSEGALLFIFAGLSFIMSLLIQLGDTKFFDFELTTAFRNVSQSTLSLVKNSDQLKLNSKTNDLLFSLFIALMSSILGALLFFPSFRLARLHFLCLKYSQGSKSKRLLYYVSFLIPLLISLCWFKTNFILNSNKKLSPNSTETTVDKFLNLIKTNSKQFDNNYYLNESKNFLMNILGAYNLRIYLVIFMFVLRLALYNHYAQSYLNLAFELASSIRKQSAKLTNVKYMSTISSIYQYYGVVANQYVIPMYVLLFLVLMLKTLGDYSWCGNSMLCNLFVDTISNYTLAFKAQNTSSSPNIFKRFESETFNITMGHNILNSVFTPTVLRSLIGYFTFWTSTIWFTISCFGLLYYQYIDRQVIYLE